MAVVKTRTEKREYIIEERVCDVCRKSMSGWTTSCSTCKKDLCEKHSVRFDNSPSLYFTARGGTTIQIQLPNTVYCREHFCDAMTLFVQQVVEAMGPKE